VKVEQACQAAFARHETFQPRWSWFRKAYQSAEDDPGVFNSEDAMLRLGVGKNMVKSIRFWAEASKILAPVADPQRPRVSHMVPTPIGKAIFSDDGWDPYCEMAGTLWLLHWLLLAPQSLLPVWWLSFNEFNAVEFTTGELTTFCMDTLSAVSMWTTPTEGSVSKDVATFSRAYGGGAQEGRRVSFDDVADSPLRELRLVRSVQAPRRSLRFSTGAKAGLPPAIAAYACLDFLARTEASARTAMVSRLVSEPGAPGRVYRLTEDVLIDLLEKAAITGTVSLSRPGGVAQLVFDKDASEAGAEMLANYYGSAPNVPGELLAGPKAGAAPEGAPTLGPEIPPPSPVGKRSGLPLDSGPPQDVLKRLDHLQDRSDAGMSK